MTISNSSTGNMVLKLAETIKRHPITQDTYVWFITIIYMARMADPEVLKTIVFIWSS